MNQNDKSSTGPLLTRKDLQHDYSWKASEGDNPHLVDFPDDVLLNRREGYEILPFINRFAAKHNLKQKRSGLKTEWLIHEKLPSDVRSHKKVRRWLEENWKAFDDEWNKKVARGDIP
ncbi:hypothetical protein [Stenotrophomonas maltophilia]|uniref:hypothetical protein n=1 Tax=Stenotrophomonas maltophilia TaxID=40324 RepID=UPI000A2FD3B0|nr:hypothetical protein [Stenotrophomonas maltophilia]ARQ89197.1 hypothetical protein A7326_06155 [Stenotrophomonas maltophilia]